MFWDIWVSRDPTFQSKNNEQTRSQEAQQGHIKHVGKFQDLFRKNGVDIWILER